MALSQADFYAYSRATGAPVPEDPRERAEMAPEVLAFRRNQLKAPEQQGPDPLSVGIGVGLALAGAGGALFGARRLMRGKTVVPSQAEFDRAKAATEERVKRAAPTTTGPVGNVLRDLSSVSAPPPSRIATADTPVSRQQVPSGQFSNVPTRANQPGSFKDLTDIQSEITAEAKTDDFLNAYLKEQQEEQQAIDKENRFQSRIVQGIESKEKALAKNILADLRREEQEAKQFTPRSYIEETGAVEARPTTTPSAWDDTEDYPEFVIPEGSKPPLRSSDPSKFSLSSLGQDPWSDLTGKQQNQQSSVVRQQQEAVDTGLDQTIQNLNSISQRDVASVKAGGFVSASESPANPTLTSLTVNPNESVVAQLNKRKALRQQVLNQTRTSLDLEAGDAPLPEGFEFQTTQAEGLQVDPGAVGKLAEQKLEEAKQRRQTPPPAPISESYRQALFDDKGLLKPEIIALHLGDENVFPGALGQELRDSLTTVSTIEARKTGKLDKIVIANPGAHLRATQHVRNNLLAQDNANTIKEYLISGGELQTPRTKGFGYTGTRSMNTEVVTITNNQGQQKILVSGPKAAARYDRSDLEPIYYDPATKSYVRKSDIGATQSVEGEAGSGIGEEIGQAIGFVPREQVEKFTTLPGTSASGKYLGEDQPKTTWSDDLFENAINEELEIQNKKQGVDYAIGGVKEFGSGKESTSLEIQPRPLFNTHYEALDANKIKITNNGNAYLKVDKLTLLANPGTERYIDPQYGTLFVNPYTGRQFSSPQEATDTYNRLTNNLNVKLIERAEKRISGLERGENLNLELSKSKTGQKNVVTRLNPNLVVEQVVTRGPSGETKTSNVTLSQALRNELLNEGLLQEHRIINEDGSEGARFFKQTRYQVPQDRTYTDKTTGQQKASVLSFKDANLPPVDVNKSDEILSAKNNYLFLQGVNNALEKITGQRVKVIDQAITLGQDPEVEFLGGPGKNPILREALTVANTLANTSETSRIRMQEPGVDAGLGERYGLGAQESRRAQPSVPSRVQSVEFPVAKVVTSTIKDPVTEELEEVSSFISTGQTKSVSNAPETIGAKRLVSALNDYKQRTGKALNKANVLQFASSIAQQEQADVDELLIQASILAKGSGKQATVGRQMKQGRQALGLMDVISPEEEIAQTVLEYDFGETVGSDLAEALAATESQSPRATMTEAQQRRAQVEPPGLSAETLGNVMEQLRAQASRRSGKRRSR